jgi:hypothetical protein
MLPHGMHLMMWWPEVLPCHLYPADMCRFAPIVLCHVSLSGEVVADMDQRVSAMWHVVGLTSSWILPWWGPLVLTLLIWTNRVVTRGGCLLTSPLWCCNVAHPLSSSIMYSLCFLYPVCTQDCCCPQVVPRIALIKSQPLINSF